MIPDGERTCDFKAIHGLFVLGPELVGSAVTLNAQRVKQTADLVIQPDFAIEFVQQVVLRSAVVKFDTAANRKLLRKGLS
ncbi:hypothetical protein GCM10007350_04990 [Jeongeupia chitinilytica]|uniref:Uncharacterized protein n=1 Tax=Jeongeupia chitinilytica TaxID=1041641 RepID=A0ABQ3GXE1_9NEIS|nr:hypothetical protein GCM10007350_04990 [Jeongeupia chitinilytica]